MQLQNGVIIVAGASKGLGREFAYTAYNAGFPVALIARSSIELTRIKKDLTNASIHIADLTDSECTTETFTEIAKIHNKIYALVNCAATWTGGTPVKNITTDMMHQSIMLNFFTAFNTIKAMLGLPKEIINNPSAIINIGATASLRGSINCAAFAVAKGALRLLSQSMARELGPDGVHVAHVIIDGLINNQRTKLLNAKTACDRYIDMHSIAKNILQVLQQEKSCWTFEWDLRTFNEKW